MDNFNHIVQALDHSASIIIMTDQDGNIRYVNRTFEKKYGYSAKEVIGQNPRILKTDYHPKEFYKNLWDTILSGKTWKGEFRNKTKNGQEIWENVIISPVISETGEITGYIAVKEDITGLKKTIEKLEESNKRYFSLVEDAPAMICRFDRKGRITYANTKYLETLFPERDDVKGTSFFHYLPERDKKIIKKHIRDLSYDSPILEYENKVILNNGDLRFHRTVCRALFNSNKEVVEYQAVSMDFTGQKETEDALSSYQKKLNAIFNNSLVGIAVFDNKGNITLANEHYLQMMGYDSVEDINNITYKKYTHPDFLEQTQQKVDALLRGDIDNFHISKKYIRKDGSEFWGDLFVSPIRGENGELIEIVGMLIDNTVRKNMELQMQENEKELKKLNETKDKLFSIIAHDIKNPFNVILGFANLLTINFYEYSKEDIKKYVGKILNASENVYKLLDDLLIWAKTQMGQMKVQKEYLNLSNIVAEIMLHFKVLSDQKNITMTREMPEEAYVFADNEMIRFVIRNLLHNAIKFTPARGKIVCRGSFLPGVFKIEIEDSGIGISKSKLDTLFNMSDIMKTKGTNHEKGTGLGLHLSREMILKNDGTISVDSAVGKGTTFTITLPLNP